jgi:HK97 gp10 family phage protein
MSDDDLIAYFNALPDQMRAQISDAVREQAVKLSDEQRRTLQQMEQAPDETGDLAASCQVVAGRDELEWIVQVGGDLTTKEVREGSGEPYDYALAFEFGNARQPARPFFWSTYNRMKDGIRTAIERVISEVLN